MEMKHSVRSRLRNLALLTTLFAAPAVAGEGPVATVNNVPISQSQLELMVKSFEAQGAKDSEELRKRLIAELVAREALAQEAAKLGLDKTSEMIAALAYTRRDLLMSAFQADYVAKHPIPEADIQSLYAQQKAEAGDKEYHLRHILLKTEAEAKSILASLRKGGKFDATAREKSEDASSRANGGDIGWQVPVVLLPAVRDVVKTLAKGQFSEPVQSPLGWHILEVVEIRNFDFPSMEKAKPALIKQLQSQAVLRAAEEVRNKAQVK